MRSAPVPSPRPKLLPAGLLRLVSDERLVDQVRAGSERAFEALFDRHYGPLLAFCRHMLGSREEAEDAVQQTFLAAYCDVLGSDKPITPRPWLFTIARNRCLSILRSRRERAVEEVTLVADNLAAEVDRLEDLRCLLADLARLPDDQRAALLLTELSGVPHDEIGRMLGCRQERVKALVFQARASLAADRTARETPCYEIRTQLATLRGGALRRAVLRRHVRNCPGCREFQAKMRLQRRQLGALLPVGPGLGLPFALPGALTGSGAVGLGGMTLKAGALGSGLVARVLVGAALTGGGAVAGVSAVGHLGPTTTVSPAAPTGNAEADARRATFVRGPDRELAVAADQIVPRLAGGPVLRAAEEDLLQGLRPGSGAVGSVPEQAGGQDLALVSAPLPAAAGDEAVEPAGQPAAQEPMEPEANAPEPDQPPPTGPPEPPSPAEPVGAGGTPPPAADGSPHPTGPAGHGPLPSTGGSAHPNGPASHGPLPSTGGSAHPNGPAGNEPLPSTGGSAHPNGPADNGPPLPAGGAGPPTRPSRATVRRRPEAVARDNAAQPPAGHASNPDPGKEPPRHTPAEVAAGHAEPHTGGPASAPASHANAGTRPGGGATPGGPAQPAGGTQAPSNGR